MLLLLHLLSNYKLTAHLPSLLVVYQAGMLLHADVVLVVLGTQISEMFYQLLSCSS
jgi:hypothetical protein